MPSAAEPSPTSSRRTRDRARSATGDQALAALHRLVDAEQGYETALQSIDETGEEARAWLRAATLARAILTVLDADDPPLRLVLGEDAVAGVRNRLGRLSTELETWQELGLATAIEGA